MKNCPKCQYPLADGVTFCSRCGAKLPATQASTIQPEPVTRPIRHSENAPHKAPKAQSNRGLVGVVWASLTVNLLLGVLLLSMILGLFGPLTQQKKLQEEVDLLQSQVRVLEEVYRGLEQPGGNWGDTTNPRPNDVPSDPPDVPPDPPDAPDSSQPRPDPTTLPTQLEEIPDDSTESESVPVEPSTQPVQSETVSPTQPDGFDGYYLVNTKEYPLNIRSTRSTDGKILGTIPIGTRIHVTAATGTGEDDWGYVEYNGICGYIAMQYLLKDFE